MNSGDEREGSIYAFMVLEYFIIFVIDGFIRELMTTCQIQLL